MIKVKIFGHWYWFLKYVSCWDCFKWLNIGSNQSVTELFIEKERFAIKKINAVLSFRKMSFWESNSAETKSFVTTATISSQRERSNFACAVIKKFNCDIFCNPTMYYGLLCYFVRQQNTKSEKGGEERDIFVHHSVVGIIIILSLYFP